MRLSKLRKTKSILCLLIGHEYALGYASAGQCEPLGQIIYCLRCGKIEHRGCPECGSNGLTGTGNGQEIKRLKCNVCNSKFVVSNLGIINETEMEYRELTKEEEKWLVKLQNVMDSQPPSLKVLQYKDNGLRYYDADTNELINRTGKMVYGFSRDI